MNQGWMNHIQLYNVASWMPRELAFLEQLSRNLWWCWNHDAIDLFRRIDPQLWKDTVHNPIQFLDRISQGKLKELAKDDGFLTHLERVQKRFHAKTRRWDVHDAYGNRPDCIAYFSLEFGIHESVRLYAGGLGCLAGDHLKRASDLDLPLVGVGLLYRKGYSQQYLNQDGWQEESFPENEIDRLPLRRAEGADGKPLLIRIPLPEGQLQAAVWMIQVGSVPLLLLDANVPENPREFRHVTTTLYDGDRQTRLRQELLLGLGGFRALIALGYGPSVCHMNEGHAAFLCLGRIEYLMKKHNLGLAEALQVLPRTDVFTTHTPVPAGNEYFASDLAKSHLTPVADELGLEPSEVLSWGRLPGDGKEKELCMTVLGLRMAHFNNGVSRLHGRVERKMWHELWPERPEDEVPIRHVTNGVHVSSWISGDNAQLFDKYLGPEWRENPSDEGVLSRIENIPDDELWKAHELGRSRLIRMAREAGERQLSARSAPRSQTTRMRSILHHGILTIGFARRFATYKRANLILRDQQRLKAILTDKDRPVQMIFAGKAHPADDTGKGLIREVVDFARKAGVRDRIIFLENYDIRVARYLVQGVDVWLNSPRRPMEASGTSGMKAAVNGALNLSVLDGWWDEGYTPECGWAIGKGEEYENTEYQDSVESQAIYNLLENEIVPYFYDRTADIPGRWIAMMKSAIAMVMRDFTSHRMLTKYNELFYRPAMEAYGKLLGDNAAGARDLVAQHKRLSGLWENVKVYVPICDQDLSMLHVGDKYTVRTTVHLGEMRPEEVDVEVYYGPVGSENHIKSSHAARMAVVQDSGNGDYVYEQEIECAATGRYGFTARVTPTGATWKPTVPGFITWADGA